MRISMTAGIAAALAALATMGHAAPASAQDMSEKSVQTLMEYAWGLVPDRFTKPDGVTIEIDRNKRKEVEVPLDQAREVIRVGRLSAHAQMCNLPEEHMANYRSLMWREDAKRKWTEQQMLYMNQLHLVTVMLLTGKLKLVEREEGKEPIVEEKEVGGSARSCTPEQQTKVKQAVEAYVKTGPGRAQSATAAGGPVPPPAAATPASAPAKK